jgi:hypothetical protein
LLGKEQRAKSKEQRAKSKEQRAFRSVKPVTSFIQEPTTMAKPKPSKPKEVKPEALKEMDIHTKRQAASGVMAKIRSQARSVQPEAWKGYTQKPRRKMRDSSTYIFDVKVFKPVSEGEVRGLVQLGDLNLNSLPNSRGEQRHGLNPMTNKPDCYDLSDLQKTVLPGMTKFFMDAQGRIIQVRRTR